MSLISDRQKNRSMEKKLFFTAAALGLLLVAYSGRDAPKKTTSKIAPSYAIEAKDEALEELRRLNRKISLHPTTDPLW